VANFLLFWFYLFFKNHPFLNNGVKDYKLKRFFDGSDNCMALGARKFVKTDEICFLQNP